MLPRIVQLVAFAVLSALLGAVIIFHRAPALEHLVPPLSVDKDALDLADMITQVVLKQSGAQALDEADINRFLTTSLTGRQQGITQSWATPDRVLCDLKDQSASLHFTWKVGPHLVHASADLSIERRGADLVFAFTGGSYGQLRVPLALLFPLRPALEKLAATCQPEISALLTLPRLKIAGEKLILDPTF